MEVIINGLRSCFPQSKGALKIEPRVCDSAAASYHSNVLALILLLSPSFAALKTITSQTLVYLWCDRHNDLTKWDSGGNLL